MLYWEDGSEINILDGQSGYSTPMMNLRGLVYDGSDLINFIGKKNSDGKNYLGTYTISGDTISIGSESNITLMLERNTVSYEKAFDMQSGEVYQIKENGIELFFNDPFDASIIAITDDNSFSDIARFIGYESSTLYFTALRNNDFQIPEIPTFETLKVKLLSAITATNVIGDLDSVHTAITLIIDQFINTINEYNQGQDLLKDVEDSAKKHLLNEIISLSPVLQKIRYKNQLSFLLFNDKDFFSRWFLRSTKINARPRMSNLLKIIYCSSKWTVATFNNELTKVELVKLQNLISQTIENFIFSNPYDIFYVNEWPHRFGTHQYKEFLKLEYNTIRSIWLSFVNYKGPLSLKKISYKQIMKEWNLGVEFTDYLTRGKKGIGIKNIYIIKAKILGYLDAEMASSRDIQKIQVYRDTISQINEYIIQRNLKLAAPRIGRSKAYDSLFENVEVKAYHVISLLVRDLGFDLLDFNPFDPDIFKRGKTATGNNFQRHHMSLIEKMLLHIKRLILTDNRNHNTLNRFAGTESGIREQQSLIDGMRELIEMEGPINADDIIRVFEGKMFGGKLISERWIQDNNLDFVGFLNEFNIRKQLLMAGDIEGLIKRISEPAYTRFYNKAMNIFESFLLIDGEIEQVRIERLFSQNDIEFIRRYFKI